MTSSLQQWIVGEWWWESALPIRHSGPNHWVQNLGLESRVRNFPDPKKISWTRHFPLKTKIPYQKTHQIADFGWGTLIRGANPWSSGFFQGHEYSGPSIPDSKFWTRRVGSVGSECQMGSAKRAPPPFFCPIMLRKIKKMETVDTTYLKELACQGLK